MTRRALTILLPIIIVLGWVTPAGANTVWASTPLRCGTYPVYLGDPPYPSGAYTREALRKLAAASGLTLPITTDPAKASVLVDWSPATSDDGGGHVTSQYGHKPTVYLHPPTPSVTLGLTLHEFGHWVGFGHSTSTVDVMSPHGWQKATDYSTDELAALATICA